MNIQLRGISKSYGNKNSSFTALKDINLCVEKGEMIAIMGPSGSGKTTLLNIMGLMDKPTVGNYILDGEDTLKFNNSKLSKFRNKNIAFIFQNFALVNNETVVDNVLMPLNFRRLSASDKKKRVMDAIESVGLSDKIKSKINELSGGQKQRVAIARAIAADTDIILADEPTGALDRDTGKDILDKLRTLNKEGKTIIIITHDITVAEYCDRTIYIEDGRLIEKEVIPV
ncbi:ABC transporter ATP-binding protein [Clostridium folliculivorans]|uniref:ABC transporter ATP-binding protein n=1 Tax=Clostridium folliculivorans TaxID=2886038 RepID=A0A9W6DBT0_9CLOT|nr:ABC transporter ATP-binding protein [Clostridium folliculivorans]GKU26281.1 ABC transporter ATP-binding protein [Clostridium folliculivorans]GKU31953.1 ABC transporter ATP-binding protein [Clostridium folliculivorans]